MGGLGNGKQSASFNFPIAQPWELRAADQSTAVKSEATSISDVTPVTYTRDQEYNTCQIMKYPYGSSFAKQSTYGEISGLAIAGQNQPVTDENVFQQAAALKQMSIDLEYSFLNGTYVAQSTAATVATTRGIITASVTNTVAADAAQLSKELIDELLIEMAGNGAIFENCVIFANAYQKTKLSDIYGSVPTDRMIGGLNIVKAVTDFGEFGIVYAPQMPTDTILIADMSVCSAVFCPYKGQVITDVPVAVTTAQEGGFLYSQVGLDYGPKEYHGTITGLATS